MKETKAMQQLKSIFASACMGILLAACSGGSGSKTSFMPTATPEMEESSASQEEEQADTSEELTSSDARDDARAAVSGQVSGLIKAIKPAFGSVLVITNPDVMGVESTFEGGSPTVTVNRDNASDIVLDPTSAEVVVDYGDEASYVDLPGRTGRTRDLLDVTDSSATFSRVAVDWDNNDPSDYLAGGYWLHIETQPAAIEVGAFIDGPELDKNNPPTLPISGTASYRGSSGGLYLAVAGTDSTYPAGSQELGGIPRHRHAQRGFLGRNDRWLRRLRG